MLRIGLIGAGSTGTAWARALAKGRDGAVSLVYAPDATATTLAGEVAAKVAVDANALITSADIDAVFIASPTHTHLEYIRAASSTGKALLSASPLVPTTGEAEELQKLPASGALAAASLPLRLRGEVVRLKELADSGKLGAIGMIRFSLGLSTVARGSDWYRNPSFSAGVTGDVGAHLVDLTKHCFGEIDRIHKLGAGKTAGLAEYALMVARLSSGAIAHLECSWREAEGQDFFYYEVAGSQGLVEYDSRKEPLLRLSSQGGISEAPLPSGAEAVAFVAALKSGGKAANSLPTLADGAKAVVLALGATDARLTAGSHHT